MGPNLSLDMQIGKARVLYRGDNTPWLEIEVPDGWLGIWLETGAIYRADKNGAMEDDAIELPAPDTSPMASWEEVGRELDKIKEERE